MAKIHQFLNPDVEIPPEWIPLIEKILRWFDLQIYPSFGTSFLGGTRSAKKRSKGHSYLKTVAGAWNPLPQATKDVWGSAADFINLNGYQLFTKDYAYRRKQGLSLPGTPHALHQMHGLRLRNLDDGEYTDLELVIPVTKYPVTISFNYKTVQNAPPNGYYWKTIARFYGVFTGETLADGHDLLLPIGNNDWTHKVKVCNTPGFTPHVLVLWFAIKDYLFDLFLEDILVEDEDGEIFSEAFHTKANKDWLFKPGQKWFGAGASHAVEGWDFSGILGIPTGAEVPRSLNEFKNPRYKIVYLG